MIRNRTLVPVLLLGAMLCNPVFAEENREFIIENMTAEQVGSWVQEPGFKVWISRMPSLAFLLAKYPYAANLFYLRSDFTAWSERNPAMARIIVDAAMRWQNKNAFEQEDFFSRHPVLRSKNLAGPAAEDGLNRQQRAQ